MKNKDIIEFVNERIRRHSFSPEDVYRRLVGRGIDDSIIKELMRKAADWKPEKPIYPPALVPKPKPKKENYAKIALSLVSEYDTEGRAMHTYWGAFHHDNRLFVKSFIDDNIEFTKEEKEAYKFTDDHICDACMAKLIMKHHAFTIALWYNGVQMVHYPGEHWWENFFLIPSFINRKGVNEFHEEGIAFDIRKGWYKKTE